MPFPRRSRINLNLRWDLCFFLPLVETNFPSLRINLGVELRSGTLKNAPVGF
jgi:hypothetical protein